MPRGRGTPTASCCGWRRGGGGSEFPEFTSDGVEYLFRDTFTDADTTGVVNGNASLGNGLGYRNIVTSAFDITSNRLNSDDAFPIIKYSPSSAHSGWNRQGGRTLVALVTLSDSAGELGISLSNSPTTIDGFTFYIKSKTCYVRTPDLGAVKVYQEQDNPAKAIRYLMGITLNKDQGAIFWISSLETYDPSFDWSLPKYPQAKIVFVASESTSSIIQTFYVPRGGRAVFEDPLCPLRILCGSVGLPLLTTHHLALSTRRSPHPRPLSLRERGEGRVR